jgi:hypothetical protein
MQWIIVTMPGKLPGIVVYEIKTYESVGDI